MAQLCIDVPDAYVPDLAAALAQENGEPEPAATPIARRDVAIRWLKREWKARIVGYRANRDADASRASNPASGW